MKLALVPTVLLTLVTTGGASEYRPVRSALHAMSVHKSELDEDPDRRSERLDVYAAIIKRVAKSRHETLLLLAVGECESHFAEKVCEGDVRGDNGKAYGCWQSWAASNEDIESQAKIAIQHLRMAEKFCARREGKYADPIVNAVSLYATGKSCRWKGASKRVKAYRRHERHF
jgi:hypothetical protein